MKQKPWYQTIFYKTYHRWSLFFTSCVWRQDKGTVRWRYPLRVIPMVNFFYDLFFDDSSINQDAARALLDVLGLLNALLLGGILTLMTAVDYETLKGVDDMWWFVGGTGSYTYWHEYYNHPPSMQVCIAIALAHLAITPTNPRTLRFPKSLIYG